MRLNLFDYQLTNDINRQYSADFIRAGLVFGLIIYSVFGALDYFLLPKNYPIAWIIRFGIMTPALIVFYFLTFKEKYLPLFGAVMPVLVVCGQLGIVAMILYAEPDEGAFFVYYAGLILVSMWAGMIYRLQMAAVVFISFTSIILYNLVAIFDQNLLAGGDIHSYEFGVFLNNNFFLLSTSLLSGIGTFQMNKYHNTVFEKNEELVKERDELEKARRKAEQSDTIKTAFLANISHEIRTPMNAIMGFSQLLNDPDTSEDEKKEYAQVILHRGEDLIKVFSDLLDYSRLMAYDIQLNFDQVYVSVFINEVANFGRSQLVKQQKDPERKILTFTDIDKNKTIYTDQVRVKQILEHLMHNAVKFSSEGSIDVGCYEDHNDDGHFIVFYIKDRGIGIHDDQRELIFDGFRQADESYSRKYEGTGIGLSLSKPMATMLGGKIWFDSVIGVGSTFYLSLPLEINVKEAAGKIS